MDPTSSQKPVNILQTLVPFSDFSDPVQVKAWFEEMEKKTILYLKTNEVRYRPLNTLVDRRFSNVVCPEETCVQVGSRFIHANYVAMPDGIKYICSQAPYTPLGQECFWKAIKDNCKVFIDLTKAGEVPEVYFPTMTVAEIEKLPRLETLSLNERGSSTKTDDSVSIGVDNHLLKIGNITIKCLERIDQYGPRISIYKYLVRDDSPDVSIEEREKTVCRIKYYDWEDFSGSSVESVDSLNKCIDIELSKFISTDLRSYIGVHCRAGVGRTGAFIMCRSMRNAIQKMEVTPLNVLSKVEEALLAGRKARGPLFLQSDLQAMTLWKYIDNELKKTLLRVDNKTSK